jgi:hypothetical protein
MRGSLGRHQKEFLLRALLLAACLLLTQEAAFAQAKRSNTASCEQPSGDAELPPATDHSKLAGGYDITFVSDGPELAGHHVSGVLWLWRSSPADSSSRTGKRALASDTLQHPFYGATDIDLWHLKTQNPHTEAELKALIDPVYPPILVGVRGGLPTNRVWKEISLWIDAVLNRRDGGLGLDGAGFVLDLSELGPTGFRGHWGPAGIVQTDNGWFCATRLKSAQQ